MSPEQNSLFYWHTVSAKVSFPLLFARLYFVWCRTMFSLLLFISKIVKQSNICNALKVYLAVLALSTNVPKEYFKCKHQTANPPKGNMFLSQIVIGCIITVGPSQRQIQHGPHFSRKRNVWALRSCTKIAFISSSLYTLASLVTISFWKKNTYNIIIFMIKDFSRFTFLAF